MDKLRVIYDGKCGFCKDSVAKLKSMDWRGALVFEPSFEGDLKEMKLVDGLVTYGGFDAFRRLCLVLPLLYPFVLFVYLPGVSIIGRWCYAFIANRRYLFGKNQCADNHCHRKT